MSDTDTLADTPAGNNRPRIATLKQRSDFLAANRGWRFVSPGFILIIHRRNDGDDAVRAGYTVTKKTGNAVVRNRIKRRFRALAQQLLPEHGAAGADHVFIGRSAAADCTWDNLVADLDKGLARFADGKDSHRSSNRYGKRGKRPHK